MVSGLSKLEIAEKIDERASEMENNRVLTISLKREVQYKVEK